jgi:hypothetical protein
MPDINADAGADTEAEADAWIASARAGDFARAWAISDQIRARVTRFGDPRVPRHLQTIWNGTPLAGRRVLVRCYHGLGDTIQFARYLPLVSAISRDTIVWAQPELLPLLRTLDARLTLLPLHDGDVGVPFDIDLEIMECPYVFRTTLDTVPAAIPYLHTLSPAPRQSAASPRVGLIWRGGGWDPRRAIAFAQLRPLLRDERIEWHSLQAGAGPGAATDEQHERHPRLMPFNCVSIDDTASRLQALDLLISVDTMGAHLAGALGRPVWLLLQREADWRWLRDREDSPWYPTMRLFRQAEAGNWQGVVSAVQRALTADLRGSPSRTTAYSSPPHSAHPTATDAL